MSRATDHLTIAPVVLPLIAGAAMLLFSDRRRTVKAVVNVVSTFALVGIAAALLKMGRLVDARPAGQRGRLPSS